MGRNKLTPEMQEALQKIETARGAIVAHLGPYQRGVSKNAEGSIACPVCNTGTLFFTRAAYNGHIHARCDNPERCVFWME